MVCFINLLRVCYLYSSLYRKGLTILHSLSRSRKHEDHEGFDVSHVQYQCMYLNYLNYNIYNKGRLMPPKKTLYLNFSPIWRTDDCQSKEKIWNEIKLKQEPLQTGHSQRTVLSHPLFYHIDCFLRRLFFYIDCFITIENQILTSENKGNNRLYKII